MQVQDSLVDLMNKRWVYGFLCVFLLLALGLSSCAASVEQSPGSTAEVQSEPAQTELPEEVRETVLGAIAADQSLSPASLTIQDARPKSWPDACLGLDNADQVCAQMITPGWEVTVTDGQDVWTYRTDETGEQVRLAS